MAEIVIPVVVHGLTGRMGQIAVRALQNINKDRMVQVDGDIVRPVAIGVGRNPDKVKKIAETLSLEHSFEDIQPAMALARRLNPERQVYHNTLSTGIRKEFMLQVLPSLDSSTTAVFMEKPLAANYADGFAIVDALVKGGFKHGVVHHMLETPGVHKAVQMMPEIKPLTAQMAFGYEVGSGLAGNKEFSGQRPDFNWRFAEAGGGIILDMCHEGYLSEALFGETERLSAVARLLVPKRLSTDGRTVIDCDVEDCSHLRREHTNGVVNTSIWSWFRRINSEFGPLEITVEGENGSVVFGLYGLKVQWKETAPANRWERSVKGEKVEWRNYWQYLDLAPRDPFAVELADFLRCLLTGCKYRRDAIHALNVLGEVEALYQSAAQDGVPIERKDILYYPKPAPANWQPERLQGKLRSFD